MNKFFYIVAHTYMMRLKSKSFIISTLVTLAFVFAIANIDRIFNAFENADKADNIAVLDESGELYELLLAEIEQINLINYKDSEAQAEEDLKAGHLEGYLLLSMEDGIPSAIYKAESVTEQSAPDKLQQALQHVKESLVTAQLELNSEQLAQIYAPVAFEKVSLGEAAKTEEQMMIASTLVYLLLFVIYISVILFGSMIATEVATEKSSRVMEILISSSSPIQQMFGKIFGVALLGLTQYALIFGLGFFSIQQRMSTATEEFGLGEIIDLQSFPIELIFYAILFFLLGYFLYATLSAMLGSLVSRIEDVQTLIAPMNMLIVVAFFIAMFGMNNPDSIIVTVTSYIPFFAPMIMFLRIGLLSLPAWEIALSIGILLASVVIMGLISARVYRGGVLMYGKFSSWKDLKKAFVMSKRESR